MANSWTEEPGGLIVQGVGKESDMTEQLTLSLSAVTEHQFFHTLLMAGISKLWLDAKSILPPVYKKGIIGTQPCPFVYIPFMAAFML